jgi:hypothetical protein
MKLPTLFFRVLALCAVVTSYGCSNSDAQRDAVPSLSRPVPLPECPDADVAACDIRDAACQKRLGELAACLRENAPLDVPVELLTGPQYVERILQGVGNEPAPAIDHFNLALSKFGLANPNPAPVPDELRASVTDLGGVYSDQDKSIVIIDDGEVADVAFSDTVLVHELIHALQDADHDLSHWPDDEPRSFDSELARHTVVEGEASFYQHRAAVPLFGLDINETDLEATLREQLARSLERSLFPEQLSDAFRTVPYGMGALQTFFAWQQGGPRGTDPLWASPPRTMQRIMSELFDRNTPQEAGIDIAPPQIDSFELDSDEVLGAWALYLVWAQTFDANAMERALAWRGDHFWVYTDENNATYSLWQLEFDGPEAAAAWNDFFGNLDVFHARNGSRVYVADGTISDGALPRLTTWGNAWLHE